MMQELEEAPWKDDDSIPNIEVLRQIKIIDSGYVTAMGACNSYID